MRGEQFQRAERAGVGAAGAGWRELGLRCGPCGENGLDCCGRERERVETGWAAGVDVGRVGLGLLGWGFPSGLVWVSRFGL